MKQLLTIVFIGLVLAGCESKVVEKENSQETETQNLEEAEKEIEVFWKDFKGAIAENNIDLLISMSALNFSKNNESDYSLTEQELRNLNLDQEAHKQIAAAKVDDLVYEASPTGLNAYSFTVNYVYYEGDDEYESAIIFYFTKLKGEYKLTSIFYAG